MDRRLKPNYHYRNQSSLKMGNNLKLPPINSRINMSNIYNIRKTPIKDLKPLNINRINTKTNTPQILYINSFSDSRLPQGYMDLSFDNPINK